MAGVLASLAARGPCHAPHIRPSPEGAPPSIRAKKITVAAEVIAIRADPAPQPEIAGRYGVSQSLISQIAIVFWMAIAGRSHPSNIGSSVLKAT